MQSLRDVRNCPKKIHRLNKPMHMLLKTARSNGVAVVVTNHQTQSSVDGIYNPVVPLGGNAMSSTSKYRIHLDGINNERRRARLYSPSHPQADAFFAIDKTGFRDGITRYTS
jgi:RecA/RadA recombinase